MMQNKHSNILDTMELVIFEQRFWADNQAKGKRVNVIKMKFFFNLVAIEKLEWMSQFLWCPFRFWPVYPAHLIHTARIYDVFSAFQRHFLNLFLNKHFIFFPLVIQKDAALEEKTIVKKNASNGGSLLSGNNETDLAVLYLLFPLLKVYYTVTG